MKTSGSSTTTMRNWIVDGLLGNPLLEEVENRRHFRQLFRQLRVATQTWRRNIVRQVLRHCDNQLSNHRQLRGKELVEWLYCSKRIIVVRWADLNDFFVDFSRKNVYFCFTSNENCHFSSERPPKRVVDFPRERDRFRNKIMEIVEDFDEKSNNNGKPWKSSRILRVNPIFSFFSIFSFLMFFIFSFFFFFFFFFSSFFFIFSFFFFIFSFFIFSFFFIFFHFSIFLIFCIFHCFSFFVFFIFLHFLSCSFIFFHFLSCSFMFFHVLSFSFSCSFVFFSFFSFLHFLIFFHFLTFSFMFFHVHSFSLIFFHFLSFSNIFFHVSFMFFHFLCLCWVLKKF